MLSVLYADKLCEMAADCWRGDNWRLWSGPSCKALWESRYKVSLLACWKWFSVQSEKVFVWPVPAGEVGSSFLMCLSSPVVMGYSSRHPGGSTGSELMLIISNLFLAIKYSGLLQWHLEINWYSARFFPLLRGNGLLSALSLWPSRPWEEEVHWDFNHNDLFGFQKMVMQLFFCADVRFYIEKTL